eukprot:scaffold107981_cov18-Phaeocystis_antarctica.AAC.1
MLRSWPEDGDRMPDPVLQMALVVADAAAALVVALAAAALVVADGAAAGGRFADAVAAALG